MENLEHLKNPNTRAVHVRCPECFKLYSVNSTDFRETRPKFTCTQCETRFWLSYPECLEQEAVIGFRLDWLEPAVEPKTEPKTEPKIEPNISPETSEFVADKEQLSRTATNEAGLAPTLSERTEACSKCGTAHAPSDLECHKCGVIFSKLKKHEEKTNAKTEGVPHASGELKVAWEGILHNYEDTSGHYDFVDQALREGSLEYAAHKYGTIIDAGGPDEMANRMHENITALTVAQTESVKVPESTWGPAKVKRGFPFRVDSVLLILSTMVIVVGFFVPGLRNLIGFGVATLFLTLALKFYFRIL